MIDQLVRRLRTAQDTVGRISAGPLLVRAGIALSAVLAQLLAWPVHALADRTGAPLLLVALLPALAPRRIWPTVSAVVAVAGWVLSTSWYDQPVALWRLLGLATFLYLTHSLCALAALLPYDAVVEPAVLARWVGQALVVVLAAAVLAILLLALADRAGGDEVSWAVLVGLALAVLAAALLGWLLRRRP